RSSIEQYGAYFTRLKSYISMTDPAHLQAEDGDREAALLTDAWARAVGLTSTIDKSVLKPHVDAYVHMVAKGEAPPWTADQPLVARVRAVLAQTSRLDRDYSALIRDANDNVVPVSRSTVFRGSSLAEFVTSKASPEVVVAGAFTRTGWESYVRDGLDDRRAHKLAHDRWVFGETEEKGVEEIKAELKQLETRYFNDYRDAWMAFVKDLQVRRPENDDVALKELSAESETPWPMLLLLQTMAENTRLQPSPDSLAQNGAVQNLGGRIADAVNSAGSKAQNAIGDAGAVPTMQRPKRWVSPVEEAFAPMVTFGVPQDITSATGPTGLSHYLEKIVAALVGVLTDAKDSKVKPSAKAIAENYATAQRATSDLMDTSQNGYTRPLLSPLLLNAVTPASATAAATTPAPVPTPGRAPAPAPTHH
ncbi:MAG TPA: ImcF-related family protein, partial [Polyangiaceae bacterium]